MNDRQKVAQYIVSTLSKRFNVVDNANATDKKVIAGQFPEVLVYKKESTTDKDLVFIMKIENGGELVDSLYVWQGLAGVAGAALYIIVPRAKLDEAKKLASIAGVKARFGWYTMTEGKVADLNYE